MADNMPEYPTIPTPATPEQAAGFDTDVQTTHERGVGSSSLLKGFRGRENPSRLAPGHYGDLDPRASALQKRLMDPKLEGAARQAVLAELQAHLTNEGIEDDDAMAESVVDASPEEIRAAFGIKAPAIDPTLEAKWDSVLEGTFIVTASREMGLGPQEIQAVRDAFLQSGGMTLTPREARELGNELVEQDVLTRSEAERVFAWAKAGGLIDTSYSGGG